MACLPFAPVLGIELLIVLYKWDVTVMGWDLTMTQNWKLCWPVMMEVEVMMEKAVTTAKKAMILKTEKCF